MRLNCRLLTFLNNFFFFSSLFIHVKNKKFKRATSMGNGCVICAIMANGIIVWCACGQDRMSMLVSLIIHTNKLAHLPFLLHHVGKLHCAMPRSLDEIKVRSRHNFYTMSFAWVVQWLFWLNFQCQWYFLRNLLVERLCGWSWWCVTVSAKCVNIKY